MFGPVTQPYYSVPVDTSNQVLAALKPVSYAAVNFSIGIDSVKGTKVYHVPELSSYVAAEQIRTKGSDASGEFDEEPPPEVTHNHFIQLPQCWCTQDLEYSDDEEEAQAKKLLKTK